MVRVAYYVFHSEPIRNVVPTAEQGQLEAMVGELSQGLGVIKHEQEYMEVRERIHRMSKSVILMWLILITPSSVPSQ